MGLCGPSWMGTFTKKGVEGAPLIRISMIA